jgi:hypothetical protein
MTRPSRTASKVGYWWQEETSPEHFRMSLNEPNAEVCQSFHRTAMWLTSPCLLCARQRGAKFSNSFKRLSAACCRSNP